MPLEDVKAAIEKEKAQIEGFRDSARSAKEKASEDSLAAALFASWESVFQYRLRSLDYILGEQDGERLKSHLRLEIKALNTCRAVLDAAVENLDPGELDAEPFIRLNRRQLKEIRNARKQVRLRL